MGSSSRTTTTASSARRPPLPARRSLEGADEHVLYIGTASKILVPTLRVSWLLPPRHLREGIRVELERRGLLVNDMTGAAVAEFVASGALSAHHARAARTYAGRRSRLVAALRRHLPDHRLSGVDAGLHLVVLLPDDVDDHEVAMSLLARGVLVNPLSAYCVDATAPASSSAMPGCPRAGQMRPSGSSPASSPDRPHPRPGRAGARRAEPGRSEDVVAGVGLGRNGAEAPGLEVLERLHELGPGVHDERPVGGDRFADGSSTHDVEVEGGAAALLAVVGSRPR